MATLFRDCQRELHPGRQIETFGNKTIFYKSEDTRIPVQGAAFLKLDVEERSVSNANLKTESDIFERIANLKGDSLDDD